MNINPIIHWLCLLILYMISYQSAFAIEKKPNVIFILADDLGYGDLGCYGQKLVKTPHLDRMAAEGMRFTSVYSGATVCAPSRSVLMTGQHTGRTRVRGNAGKIALQKQALRDEDVTVAEVLKESGYRTALIGKWGLGDVGAAESGLPRKQGFDEFFGYLNQRHAHNYYPTYLWRNEEKVALKNTVPDEDEDGAGVSDNQLEYTHDLFTQEALKFVKERQPTAQKGQPFFLYLAYTIPHANNEARQHGMEVPDLGEYDQQDWPNAEKGFAAMVSRLDRDVGRLLDLLKELGLDDHTLVIFSSDNGPHQEGGRSPQFFQSSGEFSGIKRSHTDGGIRVPAIVRWPGKVPAGKVSDAVWYFADVLPTLASLAGNVRLPQAQVDGVDVSATWLGEDQKELKERFLYWEFHERGFKQASRWKHWKAIRPQLGAPLKLYDLNRDIREQIDVAEQHPEVVRKFEDYFRTARVDSPDWPMLPAETKRGKNGKRSQSNSNS